MMLTKQELMEKYKIFTDDTLRKIIKLGLPVIQEGRVKQFDSDSVDKFFEEYGQLPMKQSRIQKMKNKFDINGEEITIFINAHGKVLKCIIDKNQLERVQNISGSWVATFSKFTNSYYAIARQKDEETEKYRKVYMHRLLMGEPKKKFIDHINHDTLDNRFQNLRITEAFENSQNKKSLNARNKSGYRNVSWFKATNCWKVSLKINKKTIFIGYFHDVHKAGEAAKKARIKYMTNSFEL